MYAIFLIKVKAEMALKEAVAEALAEHKRRGESYRCLAGWQGRLDTAGRNRRAVNRQVEKHY